MFRTSTLFARFGFLRLPFPTLNNLVAENVFGSNEVIAALMDVFNTFHNWTFAMGFSYSRNVGLSALKLRDMVFRNKSIFKANKIVFSHLGLVRTFHLTLVCYRSRLFVNAFGVTTRDNSAAPLRCNDYLQVISARSNSGQISRSLRQGRRAGESPSRYKEPSLLYSTNEHCALQCG